MIHDCFARNNTFDFKNMTPFLKRHNQANNHSKAKILFSFLAISIICEHVHRLELWKSFRVWFDVATFDVASYCRISYLGYACPKLNIVLISRLNKKNEPK